MVEYKLITNLDCVQMIKDGIVYTIPADPANVDWKEYQAWLALGNEPEPAVEPEEE